MDIDALKGTSSKSSKPFGDIQTNISRHSINNTSSYELQPTPSNVSLAMNESPCMLYHHQLYN